ncbi:glycoside hydrolase superfamily [Polychytrium aggregatum]|uniref:glycoside hydrolase superfamily n=1 Tax=Polychytrium aggregatum TaxID=110093 RepID=UPI0022FE88D6|nr:glycoside hydrolase superfamily [Polychytrium aggregatum]KAI9207356.1 glycoside hydrolase superfamily [Polychytrium aggregatum]
MKTHCPVSLSLFALAALSGSVSAGNSSSAPIQLAWGFGGSAYQIEGAWNVDGKLPSVQDTFFQKNTSSPNGNVAADHYHRMQSDLAYLSQLNATAYRFSVSWSRILPNCTGEVNQAGINFYSNMIDTIRANGAEPFLTMLHWDIPQACEDRYGGFLSPQIIADFTNYASVLFDNFGDRVRYWLTQNEIDSMCDGGYATARWGPGLTGGTSARFQCVKNALLAHAQITHLGRQKMGNRKWLFSIPTIMPWVEPNDPTSENDVTAQQMMLIQNVGSVLEPCITGNYPSEILSGPFAMAGLVPFNSTEQSILKGTIDFIGLNYYTVEFVSGNGSTIEGANGQHTPSLPTGVPWQFVYPPGAEKFPNWLYDRYNLDIYITEIGYASPNEGEMTLQQIMNDPYRLQFWQSHFTYIINSINDGTPIKAVLAWALLDNFEWGSYDQRFGCIAVDYTNGTLTRTVKPAARWLSGAFSQFQNPFVGDLPAPSPSVNATTATLPTASTSPTQTTSAAPVRPAFGLGSLVAIIMLGFASVMWA